MKYLVALAVIALIYLLFFKPKKRVPDEEKPACDEMVECKTCGAYVTLDEAVLKEGAYYCSQACAYPKNGAGK